MSSETLEIVWVSVYSNPGRAKRIYHHDERCYQAIRARVPTPLSYALRAGLSACGHCIGGDDE